MESINKLFFINVLVVLIAVFIGLNFECFSSLDESITNESWFQRCGSLIVMWSVFCEFYLLKNQEKLKASLSTLETMLEEHTNLMSQENFFRYFCNRQFELFLYMTIHKFIHIQLFIGTFVWGYGDIIISNL